MTLQIACVQTDVAFGDPTENAARAISHLERFAGERPLLVVFPEAYLTGYVVDSLEAAREIAIDLSPDSPYVRDLRRACQSLGVFAVVGAIGRDEGRVLNSALLFCPSGEVHRYDKTHLPFLGVDRFVTPGGALPVFETSIGRVGVLICYDLRVPEAARELALNGADLIVLPTNWPEGAEMTPTHVAPARALENRVFVATCNRVGTEGGVRFIGQSGIYDVMGGTIVTAGDGPETITTEVDLALARQKRSVIRPGEYELDVMGSRRPELYGTSAREYSYENEHAP